MYNGKTHAQQQKHTDNNRKHPNVAFEIHFSCKETNVKLFSSGDVMDCFVLIQWIGDYFCLMKVVTRMSSFIIFIWFEEKLSIPSPCVFFSL